MEISTEEGMLRAGLGPILPHAWPAHRMNERAVVCCCHSLQHIAAKVARRGRAMANPPNAKKHQTLTAGSFSNGKRK